MKKINKRKKRYLLTLRDHRLNEERRLAVFRASKTGKRAARRRPGKDKHRKVKAPRVLDLYRPDNHTLTTRFLQELRIAASSGKRVLICFADTEHITAAAGILVLSEIDRITKEYGNSKLAATRPIPKRGSYGKCDWRAAASLERIGVFKKLGMGTQVRTKNVPMVDCWQVESGNIADGSTAGKMLKAIDTLIPNKTKRPLYRGAIEALSNCVEHAYTGIRSDGLNIEDKRWWMFTAQIDNRMCVLVCDLGVGIPNTIQKTQSKSTIQTIFRKFNFWAANDAGWIKTATLVKETSTEKTYRGKGGGDLRQLVTVDDKAILTIFSNYGYYRHSSLVGKKSKKLYAKPEVLFDNDNSILGTIVEWSVELT